jgi:hypothetical protein
VGAFSGGRGSDDTGTSISTEEEGSLGGYRWFRSPNIIPIEQWRRKKVQGTLPSGTAA